MPLPRPDKELINRILSTRPGRYHQDDLLSDIQSAALETIGDGAITPPRAQALLTSLESIPSAAKVFPNTVLADSLRKALSPGAWSSDVEHDLLVFIFGCYANDSIDEVVSELIDSPLPLFGDIYPALFDTPTEPVNLHGRICDFTGSFSCGSRRQCFEIIAAAGGAASEGGAGTDYLFVAEKHVTARVISSAIRTALQRRQRSGTPMILPEQYFLSAAGLMP